jgi:hypothetical protein
MVFLGVMGAFFVDDWKSARQDGAMEVQYLQRMAEDLRGDSATMAGTWTRALEAKSGAMRVVGPYVRGQTRVVGDTLAFIHAVGLVGSGGFTAWQFSTPTMNDLEATGNLRVIRNAELRSGIVEYYRYLDMQLARIQARLPIYPMAVHALIPSEARDDIDMAMLREWNVGRALTRLRTEAFQDTFDQEANSAMFQATILPLLRAGNNDLLAAVATELQRLGGG